METAAIGKSFHVKLDKKQKIFFCTPASKFYKISTTEQNRFIRRNKKNKKVIL